MGPTTNGILKEVGSLSGEKQGVTRTDLAKEVIPVWSLAERVEMIRVNKEAKVF